jgi:hypothetical protein
LPEEDAADDMRTPKPPSIDKLPSAPKFIGASTETSPRDSSEDSYDVVSDQPEVKAAQAKAEAAKKSDDSDDSDWE